MVLAVSVILSDCGGGTVTKEEKKTSDNLYASQTNDSPITVADGSIKILTAPNSYTVTVQNQGNDNTCKVQLKGYPAHGIHVRDSSGAVQHDPGALQAWKITTADGQASVTEENGSLVLHSKVAIAQNSSSSCESPVKFMKSGGSTAHLKNGTTEKLIGYDHGSVCIHYAKRPGPTSVDDTKCP